MRSSPPRQARAFVVSNAACVSSALPSLVLAWTWPQLERTSGAALLYLATLWRFAVCVGVLSLRRPRERAEAQPWACIARACLFAAPLETATLVGLLDGYTTTPPPDGPLLGTSAPLRFLLALFVFEVLFDLGHYATHRLCHAHPWLYVASGHKKHHATVLPTPLSTFSQDVVDVVLSNVVPVFFACEALWRVGGFRFSPIELMLVFGYKTWIEVAGHVGDVTGRATSFPLCVWLPRALHIELRTRDHDAHHSHGGKFNFSKRFTLWDRLFGTYVDTTPVAEFD